MLLLVVATVSVAVSASRTGAQEVLVYRTNTVRIMTIDVKQIARELLTPSAFKCWVGIVRAESHFDSNAKNPNSTASGMAQLLDSTYRAIGMKPSTNPSAQFISQLAYISRHYGGNNGLCNAYHNELRYHNY